MKGPRERLAIVATKLGPLSGRTVFVGGVIRGLLTTDPGAAPPRATDDVDLFVTRVDTPAEYYELGEQLRSLGFREDDREGAPRCRWIVAEITVDVMSPDPYAMGFTNIWYESAQHHVQVSHWDGAAIPHLDAPHFCATKLEAFAARGNGEYYHHDIEDFITLVDERASLLDEIRAAPSEVRAFVSGYTSELLAQEAFVECIAGHLRGDAGSQARLPLVRARLDAIAQLAEPQEPTDETETHHDARGVNASGARPGGGDAGGPLAPNRTYVRSSNLKWVEYDAAIQRLHVGFAEGSAYRYDHVPAAVFDGLMSARSKGRFFHVWIKRHPERYPFVRLTPRRGR